MKSNKSLTFNPNSIIPTTSIFVQLFLLFFAIICTIIAVSLPLLSHNSKTTISNYEITYGTAQWWQTIWGYDTPLRFALIDDNRSFQIQSPIVANSRIRRQLQNANLQAGDNVRIKHARVGSIGNIQEVYQLEINGVIIFSIEDSVRLMSNNTIGIAILVATLVGIVAIVCYVFFVVNIIRGRKYKNKSSAI